MPDGGRPGVTAARLLPVAPVMAMSVMVMAVAPVPVMTVSVVPVPVVPMPVVPVPVVPVMPAPMHLGGHRGIIPDRRSEAGIDRRRSLGAPDGRSNREQSRHCRKAQKSLHVHCFLRGSCEALRRIGASTSCELPGYEACRERRLNGVSRISPHR